MHIFSGIAEAGGGLRDQDVLPAVEEQETVWVSLFLLFVLSLASNIC